MTFLGLCESAVDTGAKKDELGFKFVCARIRKCMFEPIVELHPTGQLHERFLVCAPELGLLLSDSDRFLFNGRDEFTELLEGNRFCFVPGEPELAHYLIVVNPENGTTVGKIGAKCEFSKPGRGSG